MNNYALLLAYDGTDFFGWQKTKMGPSIEEALETAMEPILSEKPVLQAASRTDRGVHAEGQVVNFFTSKTFDLSKFKASLNSLLPKSMTVLQLALQQPSFHPTLSATGKEYVYTITTGPTQLPHLRHYAWHVPYSLNIDEMHLAAQKLIGVHDFSSFCNQRKNLSYEDKIRELYEIAIFASETELKFKVCGNHFLYKMVRNLVGTLIYVGRGKLKSADMDGLLTAKSRPQAGVTAPAHGLSLKKIFYSDKIFTL